MFSASLFITLYAVARNGVFGTPTAPFSAGKDVDHYPSHPRALAYITFQQDLVWQSCDTFGVKRPLPGLYCTHVEVPMDYHNSSAGTANLAVVKYTAAEPCKSKGSVFVNPGMYPCRLPGTAMLIYLLEAVLVRPEPLCSLALLNP